MVGVELAIVVAAKIAAWLTLGAMMLVIVAAFVKTANWLLGKS